MKNNSNKHSCELEFEVENFVFLKVWPYRQSSVKNACVRSLMWRFMDPSKFLTVSEKWLIEFSYLWLIHRVFHISQLKPVFSVGHSVNPLPLVLNDLDEFFTVPHELLETRYSSMGFLEELIKSRGITNHENLWMSRNWLLNFQILSLGTSCILLGVPIRCWGCTFKNRGHLIRKQCMKNSSEKTRLQSEALPFQIA